MSSDPAECKGRQMFRHEFATALVLGTPLGVYRKPPEGGLSPPRVKPWVRLHQAQALDVWRQPEDSCKLRS
jgi:hypothetical protein